MRRAAVVGVVAALLAERGHASAEARFLWHLSGEGRGTPAAAGTVVYFLSKRHEVTAVDAETGSVRWRRSTGSPGDATAGAVVLASGSRLVVADGDLVAFDLQSGAMRWRSGNSGDGAALHLGVARDDVVFAGSVNGWLHAVEAETGRTRWQTPIETLRPTTVFAPVLAGENVAAAFVEASGEHGGLVMVDAGSGQERWRVTLDSTPAGAAHPASRPLVIGGLILLSVTDGSIRAWSVRDGDPQWSISAGPRERVRMLQRDFRPLVVAGPTLIVGSLTGWLGAYDLLTRRALWLTRPIDASVAFGMAADEETVYVPFLSGTLVALEARTGRERWRTDGLARGFSWTPLIWDGRVYAAASDGGYFAFRQ